MDDDAMCCHVDAMLMLVARGIHLPLRYVLHRMLAACSSSSTPESVLSQLHPASTLSSVLHTPIITSHADLYDVNPIFLEFAQQLQTQTHAHAHAHAQASVLCVIVWQTRLVYITRSGMRRRRRRVMRVRRRWMQRLCMLWHHHHVCNIMSRPSSYPSHTHAPHHARVMMRSAVSLPHPTHTTTARCSHGPSSWRVMYAGAV